MDEKLTKYNITAKKIDQGNRLDRFIAEHIEDISRSRIKHLIEEGNASKAGGLITDCSYKVKAQDEFELIIPEVKPPTMRANDQIELDIVYEDDDFLIINKQSGLTVHPGAGNYDDTLANALLHHCAGRLSGIGGVERPGIVHRLDKDTSGLMLAAKNDMAHQHLSKQISQRSLKRSYLAFCWGVPTPMEGSIEGNIGRSPKNRKKMAVVPSGGKEALTYYKVLEVFGKNLVSLVECRLQTGRTHQIRVHFTEKGHPLLGDPDYGRPKTGTLKALPEEVQHYLKSFNCQALHSYKIGVEKPSDDTYMEISSELREDMRELLEMLRKC